MDGENKVQNSEVRLFRNISHSARVRSGRKPLKTVPIIFTIYEPPKPDLTHKTRQNLYDCSLFFIEKRYLNIEKQ